MSMTSVAPQDQAVRAGVFKYLKPAVEHSLYRNGKVLTRRDRDGSDASWEGVDLEPRSMQVHDARSVEAGGRRTLVHNGFEILARPMGQPNLDFFSHDQVVRSYYPECAEIVRAASGAGFAAAFDHNIRSATGKRDKHRIRGGQEVRDPPMWSMAIIP